MWLPDYNTKLDLHFGSFKTIFKYKFIFGIFNIVLKDSKKHINYSKQIRVVKRTSKIE